MSKRPSRCRDGRLALLNREINAALVQPNVREQMTTLGLETHTEPPESFTETIRNDFVRWGKLARDINFKPL